ncbi:unnamed protein product [Miscanthus lutarioriparius]|uniref:Uncharacterized protein n=1 Tax=Miscanthus lutarioriparius TaxID=422564 RepID=A0A811NEI6_9POAL|nr:unnamed protein product [Miscanthus lutarioriparius]
MQGRTRGRCARPVDSSKERQASASAFAAKKQGRRRRRRRLFSSPLSVKLQRPAPVVKALEREELRDIAAKEAVKGNHFFLEADIKGPGLKLDNTGKAILTRYLDERDVS